MFGTAVIDQCMRQYDQDQGRLTVVDADNAGVGTVDGQVLSDM
jgi:hypothetical protein